MRYSAIDKQLFIENRKKFQANLKPDSIAFFNSNDEMPRNGDQNFPYRQVRFADQLKSKYPNHHYERSAPILASLRAIKHPVEVDLMKRAVDITDKAFQRVLNFIKPGVIEYEVEAEITHEFIRNGA